MPEWDRFKIDVGDDLAAELRRVRHVVHVPIARRIIEDGRIKAGLIYDHSRLNRSRISVAWVSANTWGPGSIYGTIEFQFEWKDLVADQKIYWVEAMDDYSPTAYRFLLTDRELSPRFAQRYDPQSDDGPLRLHDRKWFWNSSFTSEFMIEEDLLLERSTGLDFVSHNREYCRPFRNRCEDQRRQPSPHRTGGRLLSHILATDLHILDRHLKPDGVVDRYALLETAFSGLHDVLRRKTTFAGALKSADSCYRAVRGALALYGMDQIKPARNLLSLIASAEHFDQALTEIVRDHFDAPEWKPDW